MRFYLQRNNYIHVITNVVFQLYIQAT